MSFSVNKLAKFSSNPGKLHFEGLVNLMRYISDIKLLSLKHYDDMKYAPLSYLLMQAIIDTDNKFIGFSDFSCQYCSDTGIITGS